MPNGTDTCAKPGTGPGQCGAGIPAGTKLAFSLIYNIFPGDKPGDRPPALG